MFNSFNFDFSGLNNFGFDPNVLLNSPLVNPAVSPTIPPATNNLDVITRFVRANEVQFVGSSLCPDKIPIFWFDSTNVSAFCQKSNRITLNAANNATIFADGEGVVDSTTNAFATVLSTSNNIVYINQNYVSLNITAYGANTLNSNDYLVDDVVLQTTDGTLAGATTFQARVAYFDNANSVIALQPQTGTLNVATGATAVLIKRNGTNLSNAASIIRGNVFAPNSLIRGSVNVGNTGLITLSEHSSGVFSAANGSNTLTILTQANTSTAVGNTLFITSGIGFGEARTIVAVTSNNELVLNAAISSLASNSKYTFGPHVVDEFGKITGIFHIPESPNFNFPTGTRIFTITDNQVNSVSNNEYLMRGTANYEVGGKPADIVPPPVIVRPPVPIPRGRRRDPLAQTFFTPEVNTQVAGAPKSNYGIFVSSVDLFFAEKPILVDLQLPVTVQIVEVSNGLPTEKVLASSTVECKDVKISTIPDAANNDTITNFRFADPVYLRPDSEYALVVISDSPDYNVFICELGGFILGATPPRRVSQQPYLGSLFKSQNASTWTPVQNQDLMFRLRKCVFTESTGTALFKPENQLANVNIDTIVVHTLESNYKPTGTRYKIRSNNVSNVQDADFTYIPINQMYGFGQDLTTSLKTSNRRRTIFVGDSASMNLGVELATSDPDVSPVLNHERISIIALENFINDASLANTDISITSGGNHINAANITVTISAPDLGDGVQANAYVSALSSNAVATIIVDEPGSGYITTPTITFSEPAVASNATGVISGETGAVGGNCKTRYVTKMITLVDGFDAGDMRVYIDANRPRGTNIHVYYKVMSASDTDKFTNKKWQLMNKVSDSYSKDQIQVIELEYRPSLTTNVLSYTENGVVYPLGGKFKYYAIKIVMTAADTTVIPTIRNFRAIATPSG